MIKTVLMFFMTLFFVSTLFLKSVHSIPGSNNSAKDDSVKVKKNGIIFIPALFYTPETKIAGGASVMYYFRGATSLPDSRPSTISPVFVYTQKNQIIGMLFTDFYWQDEVYHLNGGVSYTKFPDKFFGIGSSTPDSLEEDYTPRTAMFLLNMQKKILKSLYIGLQYEFGHSKLSEVESNGLLAGNQVPGSSGGTVSGAGFFTNWDSRNSIFTPSTGSFHQFSATFFHSAIGSDYNFNRYMLDLRKYFPVGKSNVLAFQSYLSFKSGNVPFQMMSKIGGQLLMRGYYEGRYRDKNSIILQSEYRMHVWRRIGMVAFAGFGEVADRLSHFDLNDVKYSLGLGFRFLFSRNEGLNLRADFGFGQGSSGFYIALGEAF